MMKLVLSRRRWLLVKLGICFAILWGIFTFYLETADLYQGNEIIDLTSLQRQKFQLEAFGPPMKTGDETDAANSSVREDTSADIMRDSNYYLNPNLPFYKRDNKSQPGEMGKAVKIATGDLSPAELKRYNDGFSQNAFNQYVSDMISIHRELPSFIDEECKTEIYHSDLPNTSVVICFHNEAWSVLLRTVHSVLDRTPSHLLAEIILVDDFSDMPHLKEPLETYMRDFPKVRIIGLEKREGLIRARLRGSAVSSGSVITFLDSHCECLIGWMEPILNRIKRDPSTVACPVIDVIDDKTFELNYAKAHNTNVGGFDWSLQFNWHQIPDRLRENRRDIDPVQSPTMAGGLFSIDRAYFEKLGSYDPGFDIWGGENLELSFKIWMCGGTLEIVPCSHVGHIFRKRSPYKWKSGVNVLRKNSVRLAEVWLDDYKNNYYERINYELGNYGDISERKALRERLKCHSFKWYLDNIYPEMFVPNDAIAVGEVRNLGGGKSKNCLDWNSHGEKKDQAGLYVCHNQGGNQYWLYSKDGEIRRDDSCIDYTGRAVLMYNCHGSKGNQEWKYDHKIHQLYHVVSEKCLEMSRNGALLLMKNCDTGNPYQQWVFKTYSEDKANKFGL